MPSLLVKGLFFASYLLSYLTPQFQIMHVQGHDLSRNRGQEGFSLRASTSSRRGAKAVLARASPERTKKYRLRQPIKIRTIEKNICWRRCCFCNFVSHTFFMGLLEDEKYNCCRNCSVRFFLLSSTSWSSSLLPTIWRIIHFALSIAAANANLNGHW